LFIVIGENVHTTRVLSRAGRKVLRDGEQAWIAFDDGAGPRRLAVPSWVRDTQAWDQGQLKHVAIAITQAMTGGSDTEDAIDYLRHLVDKQVEAGAAYLDLNVDELSTRLADQQAAMAWLVENVQGWTDVSIAVDSSHQSIMEAGFSAARPGSRPMLNSASLERKSALDLAANAGGPVIVTAAGAFRMPSDAAQRIANASAMVDDALAHGIALGNIYVDPLIFPVSVDGEFGPHALDAMSEIRRRYGSEIHITGGMSNVSFGIPGRKLLNEVFLQLAIEAGADSGIVDPVSTDIEGVMALDLSAEPYALARDALLGVDANCREFLRAYRAGGFSELGIGPAARKVN
jgi:cobalamin-dependent methionine synthase I